MLQRWAETARVGAIGRPSAAGVWIVRWIARPWMRLMHRPRIEGVENLPQEGAYLLVANHSGALPLTEVFSFAAQWLEQVGVERPIAGFALPSAFHVWPVAWLMRSLGTIPSSYEWGRKALGSGVPLLIFPGGDRDATRPIWKYRTVDFGGRVGFLKLARQAGVPIVPMAFRGAHFSVPIVGQVRGPLRWLCVVPVLVGIKYWPITLLGVVGAIGILALHPTVLGALAAWLWVATPLSFVPWVPWPVRACIGAPLRELPEDLPSALVVVESRIAALLNEAGVPGSSSSP